MAQRKTVTNVTTTETSIKFDDLYPFVWIENQGENDCYASNKAGITAEADDVALIRAGESKRIDTVSDTVYVKAAESTTTLELHAQTDALCPFKVSGKGGDVPIAIDPTPTQGSSNAVSSGGVYTALQNVGGFTRTVLYDSGGYDRYAPFQTDVPLLDNLSNYDFIQVWISTDRDQTTYTNGYWVSSAWYDVTNILTDGGAKVNWSGYSNRSIGVEFTNTKFNIFFSSANGEDSGYIPQIYKIYGYKF